MNFFSRSSSDGDDPPGPDNEPSSCSESLDADGCSGDVTVSDVELRLDAGGMSEFERDRGV